MGAVVGAGPGPDDGDRAQRPHPQAGPPPHPQPDGPGVAQVVELAPAIRLAGTDEPPAARPRDGEVPLAGRPAPARAGSPAIRSSVTPAAAGRIGPRPAQPPYHAPTAPRSPSQPPGDLVARLDDPGEGGPRPAVPLRRAPTPPLIRDGTADRRRVDAPCVGTPGDAAAAAAAPATSVASGRSWPRQVRDGPGDPQHPVQPAGGEQTALHVPLGLVQRARRARASGCAARGRAPRCWCARGCPRSRAAARSLAARTRSATGRGGLAPRAAPGELGAGDRLDLHPQVDPVEQRPGEPRLVAADRRGRALAAAVAAARSARTGRGWRPAPSGTGRAAARPRRCARSPRARTPAAGAARPAPGR